MSIRFRTIEPDPDIARRDLFSSPDRGAGRRDWLGRVRDAILAARARRAANRL